MNASCGKAELSSLEVKEVLPLAVHDSLQLRKHNPEPKTFRESGCFGTMLPTMSECLAIITVAAEAMISHSKIYGGCLSVKADSLFVSSHMLSVIAFYDWLHCCLNG